MLESTVIDVAFVDHRWVEVVVHLPLQVQAHVADIRYPFPGHPIVIMQWLLHEFRPWRYLYREIVGHVSKINILFSEIVPETFKLHDPPLHIVRESQRLPVMYHRCRGAGQHLLDHARGSQGL